jgi:hypothetical protein
VAIKIDVCETDMAIELLFNYTSMDMADLQRSHAASSCKMPYVHSIYKNSDKTNDNHDQAISPVSQAELSSDVSDTISSTCLAYEGKKS